ncbi:MutS protein 5 [Dispira simplex]|nr:MutS protein 5 [Dispira simplex]
MKPTPDHYTRVDRSTPSTHRTTPWPATLPSPSPSPAPSHSDARLRSYTHSWGVVHPDSSGVRTDGTASTRVFFTRLQSASPAPRSNAESWDDHASLHSHYSNHVNRRIHHLCRSIATLENPAELNDSGLDQLSTPSESSLPRDMPLALAYSRSNTLTLPSSRISETISSGTGQQTITSHEPSFVDSVVLALTTSRDTLGCAYFHQRDRTLYYLQDAVQTFRIELYSEIKQQVLPTRVILDSGMGPQFIKGIKEAERATNSPAQVMVVPPGDFSRVAATSWLTSQGLTLQGPPYHILRESPQNIDNDSSVNESTCNLSVSDPAFQQCDSALLKAWLYRPLRNVGDIDQRLDGVAFYASSTSTTLRNTLRTFLKGMNGGLVLRRLPGKLSLADWQGLTKFLEQGLQLLSTVSRMEEHRLIIHQRISAVESEKLHKVLDRIRVVIDFTNSKHENRVVVNQGFDKVDRETEILQDLLSLVIKDYDEIDQLYYHCAALDWYGDSSFTADLKRIKRAITQCTKHSFFLCDEFGKGTAASGKLM